MTQIFVGKMCRAHWPEVARIYEEGIKTKVATFEDGVPEYDKWNQEHLPTCRLVAYNQKEEIVGWAALTPVSNRCVYQGVAEVSIYVTPSENGKGVGTKLLNQLIQDAEAAGLWTLQSSIISRNLGSIRLHEKCGFRHIGYRERISMDMDGKWQNIQLMERRSK